MKDIKKLINSVVEEVLNEQVNQKVKEITESVEQEIDEMEEYYEVAKKRREERMAKKEESKEGKVVGVYSDINKQRKEMSEEELSEDSFSYAAALAKVDGKEEFEFGGEKHPVTMSLEKAKRIVGDVKKDSVKDDEAQEKDLEKDIKADKKKEKEVKSESKKRTLQLTEEEMIDLIEKIVNEQKIEGISTQKNAMKATKKDNDDYLKSVVKKMKAYLKDGSAGEFEMEPKAFPRGNGEMGENEKMAYKASKGVEEYIEQIARSGGMENLDYDQIKPNEEWLDKNIEGSSETGNNPEWANAVKTKTGEKVKDRKDKNILAKLKKQSYNKAPQPVTDYAGNKTHSNSMAGIEVSESKTDNKKDKINEDLERMKKIFSHNYKTQ